MPRTTAEGHHYWEQRVKRAWEALRRNGEFRTDCMYVGDSSRSDEQFKTRFKRFTQKWGVACNDPDRSYEEVKGSVTSYRSSEAQIHGEALAKEIFPEIPECFVFLLSRLQGYSGPRDMIVQCKEEDEMHDILDANTQGQWNRMPVGEWMNHIGRWAPPDKVHLMVDVEADPFEIVHRVLDLIATLHDVRAKQGFTGPYGQQVTRKLNNQSKQSKQIGDPYDAGRRFDFGQDDDVFRVWDLKQSGKTDMEIAGVLWPDELMRGKGRDSTTGEKGPLAQRVHDYNQRATSWIKEYPKRISHVMDDDPVK